MVAYLSHAWSDAARARCLRYAPHSGVLPFAGQQSFGFAQGGRFVLVSSAGLALIRSFDSLTTSDLCACCCCPTNLFNFAYT